MEIGEKAENKILLFGLVIGGILGVIVGFYGAGIGGAIAGIIGGCIVGGLGSGLVCSIIGGIEDVRATAMLVAGVIVVLILIVSLWGVGR